MAGTATLSQGLLALFEAKHFKDSGRRKAFFKPLEESDCVLVSDFAAAAPKEDHVDEDISVACGVGDLT